MSPRLRPQREAGREPTQTAPVQRDLVVPWALVAAALWALFLTAPADDPTLTEGAIVIGAVAATVGTLLMLSRRNAQTVAEAAAAAAVAAVEAHQAASARAAPAPVPQQAPPSVPAPAPAAPSPPQPAEPERPPPPRSTDPTVRPQASPPPPPRPVDRPMEPAVQAPPEPAPTEVKRGTKGDLLRACPCGFCDRQVEDANGYLTSVTAWVIAVDRLCKQASEAMVKGGWVHLPVYEFASDTEALRELLVQTCHEGGGTRAIWTIQGLVTVWEQTLFRVEQEIAATVEPGRYLAWHTATADVRANRHGDAA